MHGLGRISKRRPAGLLVYSIAQANGIVTIINALEQLLETNARKPLLQGTAQSEAALSRKILSNLAAFSNAPNNL